MLQYVLYSIYWPPPPLPSIFHFKEKYYHVSLLRFLVWSKIPLFLCVLSLSLSFTFSSCMYYTWMTWYIYFWVFLPQNVVISPQYSQFLGEALKVFLKILDDGEPQFIAEQNMQVGTRFTFYMLFFTFTLLCTCNSLLSLYFTLLFTLNVFTFIWLWTFL